MASADVVEGFATLGERNTDPKDGAVPAAEGTADDFGPEDLGGPEGFEAPAPGFPGSASFFRIRASAR